MFAASAFLASGAILMALLPASAQQITGTPGASNATTTIDGHAAGATAL